jgi:hypothetical protein
VSTYGGGQYKSSYRGHDLIEHGGDIQGILHPASVKNRATYQPQNRAGFHSAFTRFLFEGVGVAILSNDDLFYIRDIIRYRIMDELFGLEPFGWNTRQAALHSIHPTVVANDNH